VRVHHRPGLLERGDVIFLDQGEMRDPALRLLHILRDLAAEADDPDLLVLPPRPGTPGDAATIIEQVSVEIGVADTVARIFDLRKVDTEIAGALPHRGRGLHAFLRLRWRRLRLRRAPFALAAVGVDRYFFLPPLARRAALVGADVLVRHDRLQRLGHLGHA